MKTNTKSKSTVAKSLAVVGLVAVSAFGGAVGHSLTTEPQVVITEKIVNNTVEVPVEVIKEVPVNVTVEKIVEVEDTEFLKQVCDRALFDDLQECQEEIKAEDAALKLAIEAIEAEYADEVEDADLVRDEDDAELVKVYTDFEDVVVVKSDFDDEEYKFKIDAKIEDDRKDDKFRAVFTVKVEDGEAEIVKVIEE